MLLKISSRIIVVFGVCTLEKYEGKLTRGLGPSPYIIQYHISAICIVINIRHSNVNFWLFVVYKIVLCLNLNELLDKYSSGQSTYYYYSISVICLAINIRHSNKYFVLNLQVSSLNWNKLLGKYSSGQSTYYKIEYLSCALFKYWTI